MLLSSTANSIVIQSFVFCFVCTVTIRFFYLNIFKSVLLLWLESWPDLDYGCWCNLGFFGGICSTKMCILKLLAKVVCDVAKRWLCDFFLLSKTLPLQTNYCFESLLQRTERIAWKCSQLLACSRSIFSVCSLANGKSFKNVDVQLEDSRN